MTIIDDLDNLSKTHDYQVIRDFIAGLTGIEIDKEKDYFIEYRLIPIAREFGYVKILNFILDVSNELKEVKLNRIIDAITTGETYFFRDSHPFDCLRDIIIPEVLKTKLSNQKLSIWSAVCSSGQEPYSLAILLKESFNHLKDEQIKIFASDISMTVLEKAKSGAYTSFELSRGLDDNIINKYFSRDIDTYKINSKLKYLINFFQFNLLDDYFNIPMMDIILLRNVLIYFNKKNRDIVINKIKNKLNINGFLILGATEYIDFEDDSFYRITHGKTTYYKRIK